MANVKIATESVSIKKAKVDDKGEPILNDKGNKTFETIEVWANFMTRDGEKQMYGYFDDPEQVAAYVGEAELKLDEDKFMEMGVDNKEDADTLLRDFFVDSGDIKERLSGQKCSQCDEAATFVVNAGLYGTAYACAEHISEPYDLFPVLPGFTAEWVES